MTINCVMFLFLLYIYTLTATQSDNYTDVTSLPNGTITPPNLHSTVPYSTVVHETSIME